MNVSELMIGDWVYRVDFKKPIPVRILGLEVVNYATHPKQYVADVFCPKHINNVGLYMDEICPIPLTAEILEKNGFGYIEKDVNSYEDKVLSHFYLGDECFCTNMDLHIGTYNDGVFWLNSPKVSLNGIRYLHELQHALRLAGIDKEITI